MFPYENLPRIDPFANQKQLLKDLPTFDFATQTCHGFVGLTGIEGAADVDLAQHPVHMLEIDLKIEFNQNYLLKSSRASNSHGEVSTSYELAGSSVVPLSNKLFRFHSVNEDPIVIWTDIAEKTNAWKKTICCAAKVANTREKALQKIAERRMSVESSDGSEIYVPRHMSDVYLNTMSNTETLIGAVRSASHSEDSADSSGPGFDLSRSPVRVTEEDDDMQTDGAEESDEQYGMEQERPQVGASAGDIADAVETLDSSAAPTLHAEQQQLVPTQANEVTSPEHVEVSGSSGFMVTMTATAAQEPSDSDSDLGSLLSAGTPGGAGYEWTLVLPDSTAITVRDSRAVVPAAFGEGLLQRQLSKYTMEDTAAAAAAEQQQPQGETVEKHIPTCMAQTEESRLDAKDQTVEQLLMAVEDERASVERVRAQVEAERQRMQAEREDIALVKVFLTEQTERLQYEELAQVRAAESQLEQEQQHVQEIKQQLSSEKKLVRCKSQLLHRQREQVQQNLELLSGEFRDVQRDQRTLAEKQQAAAKEKSQLAETLKQLEGERQELREREQRLSEQEEWLTQAQLQLVADRSALEMDQAELRESRLQLEQERQQVGQDCAAVDRDRAQHQSEAAAERRQLDAQQEQVDEDSRTLYEAQDRVRLELTQLAEQREAVDATRADLASRLDTVEGEKQRLAEDRVALQRERLTAMDQQREVERRLSESNRQVAAAQQTMAEQKAQIDSSLAHMETQSKQLQSVLHQVEIEKKELAEQRQQLSLETGRLIEERQRMKAVEREDVVTGKADSERTQQDGGELSAVAEERDKKIEADRFILGADKQRHIEEVQRFGEEQKEGAATAVAMADELAKRDQAQRAEHAAQQVVLEQDRADHMQSQAELSQARSDWDAECAEKRHQLNAQQQREMDEQQRQLTSDTAQYQADVDCLRLDREEPRMDRADLAAEQLLAMETGGGGDGGQQSSLVGSSEAGGSRDDLFKHRRQVLAEHKLMYETPLTLSNRLAELHKLEDSGHDHSRDMFEAKWAKSTTGSQTSLPVSPVVVVTVPGMHSSDDGSMAPGGDSGGDRDLKIPPTIAEDGGRAEEGTQAVKEEDYSQYSQWVGAESPANDSSDNISGSADDREACPTDSTTSDVGRLIRSISGGSDWLSGAFSAGAAVEEGADSPAVVVRRRVMRRVTGGAQDCIAREKLANLINQI